MLEILLTRQHFVYLKKYEEHLMKDARKSNDILDDQSYYNPIKLFDDYVNLRACRSNGVRRERGRFSSIC